MRDCIFLEETLTADGCGGQTSVWHKGKPFRAAFQFRTSTEGRRASAAEVHSDYLVTVSRDLEVRHHQVFLREDGKVFRVTQDGDDHATPATAGIDMRDFTAEEWILPGEVEA
jgi:head-tail adaptor